MLWFPNNHTVQHGVPVDLPALHTLITTDPTINKASKNDRAVFVGAIEKSYMNSRVEVHITEFSGYYVYDLDQNPNGHGDLKEQPQQVIDQTEKELLAELKTVDGFALFSRSASDKAFFCIIKGPTPKTIFEFNFYSNKIMEELEKAPTLKSVISSSQCNPGRIRYMHHWPNAVLNKQHGAMHIATPGPEDYPKTYVLTDEQKEMFRLTPEKIVEIMYYSNGGKLANDPYDYPKLRDGIWAIQHWQKNTKGISISEAKQIAFDWMKLNPKKAVDSKSGLCRQSMNMADFVRDLWMPLYRTQQVAKPVTMGSMIYNARQMGYVHNNIIADQVENYLNGGLGEKLVWTPNTGMVILRGGIPNKDNCFSDKAFRDKIMVDLGIDDVDTAGAALHVIRSAIPSGDFLEYDPTKPSGTIYDWDGSPTVNTFRNSLVDPKYDNDTMQRLWDHIVKLIPDEEDRTYLMHHITNTLINVGTKLPAAIVLQSKGRGTGKSTMCSLVAGCFQAKEHIALMRSIDLDNKFNGPLKAACVAVVEEVKCGKTGEANLKDLVGNTKAAIENKGKDLITSNLFAGFYLSTNDPKPFYDMNEEENKFFVINLDGVFKQEGEEQKKYYNKLTPDGQRFGDWIITVDASRTLLALCMDWAKKPEYILGDWRGRPPQSKAWKKMIQKLSLKGKLEQVMPDIVNATTHVVPAAHIVVEDGKITIATQDALQHYLAEIGEYYSDTPHFNNTMAKYLELDKIRRVQMKKTGLDEQTNLLYNGDLYGNNIALVKQKLAERYNSLRKRKEKVKMESDDEIFLYDEDDDKKQKHKEAAQKGIRLMMTNPTKTEAEKTEYINETLEHYRKTWGELLPQEDESQ